MLPYQRLQSNRSDWSDNTFLETYFNERKVKKIDPACWKSHIVSFLNDMYSNEVSNVYHRESYVAVILMLPHPTKSKLLFEEYINDTDGYNSDHPTNGQILNITPISQRQHSMFFCRVRNSLACADSTEDKNFTALRAALGVAALVCLRSTVKPINAIKNFFFHEFQSTMDLLYPNLNCIKELPLPSSAFFKALPIRCNKSFPAIRDILVLLVGTFTSEKKKNLDADNAILGILNHCILQAVRLNGLGVILLLEKVSKIYKVDVRTVIELICPVQEVAEPDFDEPKGLENLFNFTEEEAKIELSYYFKYGDKIEQNRERAAVYEFYSKYMANDSLEISWPWCRLIDDSYFYTCSIKDNMKAPYLAAIVSLKEPDIWNMSVFKERPMVKERAMNEAIEYDKLLRRVSS